MTMDNHFLDNLIDGLLRITRAVIQSRGGYKVLISRDVHLFIVCIVR